MTTEPFVTHHVIRYGAPRTTCGRSAWGTHNAHVACPSLQAVTCLRCLGKLRACGLMRDAMERDHDTALVMEAAR